MNDPKAPGLTAVEAAALGALLVAEELSFRRLLKLAQRQNRYLRRQDLARIEESGCARGADPHAVSPKARDRQRREMGTLGSGNHYLEVQEVAEIFAPEIAGAYGLKEGDCVITIHCGSRGLGHQIGTDFLREMVIAAPGYGLVLPDRNSIAWHPVPGATSYDVIRGDLLLLLAAAGNFADSLPSCLSNGVEGSQTSDPDSPPPGEGSYYLVRAVSCADETGSYDSGGESQSSPRAGSLPPQVCP